MASGVFSVACSSGKFLIALQVAVLLPCDITLKLQMAKKTKNHLAGGQCNTALFCSRGGGLSVKS